MAASSSGLLVSGLRSIALPLALSIAVFAPLGCSDDPPSLGEDGDLCDPIDAPCKRTQVCEGGTCVNAQRCPEGESSECPEADGDDDPLFCEYTFCVEACQTGGKHCPPPQFRCDLISKTCVPNDDTCRTNEDCVDGKLCHILEGDDTGQCIVGECKSLAGTPCVKTINKDLCEDIDVPGTCGADGACGVTSLPAGFASCPGGVSLTCFGISVCIPFDF